MDELDVLQKMEDSLKNKAVSGIQRLAEAYAKACSVEAAKALSDRAMLLSSNEAPPLEIYDACFRTCVWLCRGEGDKTVVEGGQLPYRDTAQIPLDLWQYCRSLELPVHEMGFVMKQIADYERMLRWTVEKEGEQDGAFNGG